MKKKYLSVLLVLGLVLVGCGSQTPGGTENKPAAEKAAAASAVSSEAAVNDTSVSVVPDNAAESAAQSSVPAVVQESQADFETQNAVPADEENPSENQAYDTTDEPGTIATDDEEIGEERFENENNPELGEEDDDSASSEEELSQEILEIFENGGARAE